MCSTSKEMECINNKIVNTSSCLKTCSGLIVTSFFKSENKYDLETLFPIFGDYNRFKKVTTYPSVASGKYIKYTLIFQFLIEMLQNLNGKTR